MSRRWSEFERGVLSERRKVLDLIEGMRKSNEAAAERAGNAGRESVRSHRISDAETLRMLYEKVAGRPVKR